MPGVTNSVEGPEAAPYLAKSGGTMAGALILNTSSPTVNLEAASKGYVDNIVLNIHPACLAASTANLTATYDNVSVPPSGIGGTLTNAGAFAIFSIDGVAPAVGQRVLIKNQSSQLENGVYTVTVVGDAVSVNWVLTRALDYDEPSDMHAGDKFAVVSGTTQAATEWMMTQTAAISVGVTAITFVEMGQVAVNITTVATQTITATGAFNYTPTANTQYAIFELQAGGGGSGGTTGTAAQAAHAGGGGGGGYLKILVSGTTNLSAISGSVAVGGTAGAIGVNNGGAGGNTTLVINGGSTWTAGGGTGGLGKASSGSAQPSGIPGIGGTNTAGTNGTLILDLPGNAGSLGFSNGLEVFIISVSIGGDSQLGKGSRSFATGGASGVNYGGGASGGANQSGANSAGSAGAQGVVVVTEFISA